MNDPLYVELKELIAEIIEIDDFEGHTRFLEDLEVDSMLALEILAEVERNYKLSIPESELNELATLDQVYNLVRRKLSESHGAEAAA